MEILAQLIRALVLVAADRNRLVVENTALRQQINVLQRSVTRPRLDDTDRMFWIFLRRWVRGWRDLLVIVQPETVIRWHRNGYRYYWRKRSQATPGRPPIGRDVIALIKRLSSENALWGAPRVQSELRLLGHEVAESTVAKYIVPRKRGDTQRWRTFLKNHMSVSAACDFFTVPSLTFKALYVFVVLSHDRRRILHVNVTRHPTAAWAAHQITESLPDGEEPRFLHRDRDAIYGEAFVRRVGSFGIEEVLSGEAVAMAEPVRRARDRLHPPGVHRPHHPA